MAVAVWLAACSSDNAGTGSNGGSRASSATQSRVQQDLALYQQMVQLQRWEQAQRAADILLRDYPNSPEAAQLRQSYDDIAAKAKAAAESRRSAGLWMYHAVEDAETHGIVRTAQIHRQGDQAASDGRYASQQLRLVLRKHPAWGDSAYLQIDNGGRFECGASCRVNIRFDNGEPKVFSAKSTTGNETPTLFLDDYAGFVEALNQSQQVQIEVPFADGSKPALFEVGGFNRAKFEGTEK